MPEIRHALVTALLSKKNMDTLTRLIEPGEVTFCAPEDGEKIKGAIKTADVAILNSDLDETILTGQKLKWIHSFRAGLDQSARPEVFERGIILTGSAGRSAPALAEHALFFMLNLSYDISLILKAQADHRWSANRELYFKSGLFGKTIAILGLGKTGCEVARLAKCFNMKVLGWRRSAGLPENVDEVYSSDRGDSILPMLSEADYVVLCAELNDSTWHVIGKKELSCMKPSAFMVNIGRGELIDEPALIEALQSGKIAGAGLDTFEVEPLKDANPLWDMPNVIITPHVTPRLPDRDDRAFDYILQNVEAYRRGSGFVNRLSEKSIYSKQSS